MDKSRKIELENRLMGILDKLIEEARFHDLFEGMNEASFILDELDLAETAAREIVAAVVGMGMEAVDGA
jgi:hypothetical protein